MNEFDEIRHSLTAEGRADQIIRDLSHHIAEEQAGEWLLPDTCLWLHREIRQQIQNAEEMAQHEGQAD